MGTIGTGTEGKEQAVEMRATDAWRSKNLEVHFTDQGQSTRSIRVKGGRVVSADSDTDLIGHALFSQPVVGDLLGIIQAANVLKSDLLVSSVVELESDDAVHGGPFEETAAAPAAEQTDGAAAAQDSSAAGSETPAPLVDAILKMSQLMLRVRKFARLPFAKQFLSLAAAAEIMAGSEAESDFVCSMYETINERMEKLAFKDEAQQMAALFILHTSAEPAAVESARKTLVGVDKKVTAKGIGRFSLTDFQKAGCPPEDLVWLRLLISIAPTETQQQEGSAAHVG